MATHPAQYLFDRIDQDHDHMAALAFAVLDAAGVTGEAAIAAAAEGMLVGARRYSESWAGRDTNLMSAYDARQASRAYTRVCELERIAADARARMAKVAA